MSGPIPALSASRKRQRTVPTDKSRPAYPRKRAAQACCTCRKRRTKCDNEQPACGSCVGLGIECFYDEKDKSTFDAASLAILRRLDDLEELMRSPDGSQQLQPQLIEETSPLTVSTVLKDLGSPALERDNSTPRYYPNIETIFSWPVFKDQNLDQRPDLKTLLRSGDSNPSLTSIPSDFENDGARKLLDVFFEHVHIYNPVLEVSKVRQYLREVQLNGLGWNAQSCLLLLVYALGSISAPHQNSPSESSSTFHRYEEYKEANAFFFAAQKRMGILLCNSGVIEAQCFFLAGVFLMATFRPIEAWRMFVQALACCRGFNTHDCSEAEHRLQESIYWTCFKSELELRLELNLVDHSVWDLTYPPYFPSPPQDLKTQAEAAWYFYLAEIALRRLGNRILNYVCQYESSHISTTMIDAVLNFEQQAADWLSSLPSALQLDATNDEVGGPGSELYSSLRFILDGHLIDCYELMYWPFIVDSIRNNLESETYARKGFQLCIQRIEKNEIGFHQRHHGTWLMLRSCTRSAFVLIAGARSGLGYLLPANWEASVESTMNLLRYWKEETGDIRDRLNILEGLMRDIDLTPNTL
ncbi:hypothetical protein B0J14DRAFT_662819 [Halenospora varia]|nr:hypothetical protein B0J14DRAFT_662819 [Halenospora varia]